MNFFDTTFAFFKKLNTFSYLSGLCVLAISIRAVGIDSVNLSVEEVEFLYYSHPSTSLDELFHICKNGLPIFDFALYRLWFTLVGFSILKAKYVSFFFNILLIPLGYFLSKKISDKESEARFTAFLLTIALSLIALANNPRFYNELLLFSTLSFYFFLDFLKQKTSASSVFLFIVFTTASILSHYFAVFLFVSQFLIIVFLYIKNRLTKIKLLLAFISFLSVTIIVGLVFSSFMYLLKNGNDYLHESSNPLIIFSHVYIFLGQDPVLFLCCLVLIIIYIKKTTSLKTKTEPNYKKTVILMWLLFTFTIPTLVDLFYKPIIRRDYNLILFIPLLILVSWGFGLLQHRWKMRVIVLISCSSIVNICFIQSYYNEPENTLYRTEFSVGKLTCEISKKPVPIPTFLFASQELLYNFYFQYVWNSNYRATAYIDKINLLTTEKVCVIKHREELVNGDAITNQKIVDHFTLQDSIKIELESFYVYSRNKTDTVSKKESLK